MAPGIQQLHIQTYFLFSRSYSFLFQISCLAAISAVVISGDWEGSLLFYDVETQSQHHIVEDAHPGGVSSVVAFSSSDVESFFAGHNFSFSEFMYLQFLFLFANEYLPVTTGIGLTCKLWTHHGTLLNIIPLSRSVANGNGFP